VVFVVEKLDGDGTEVGLIRGMMAVGAILGSLLIARLAGQADPLWLQVIGFAGMGLVSLVFWNAPALTTALWVFVAIFALSGVPGAALSTGFTTAIQTLAPPDAVGRVAGAVFAASAAGEAVGSIAAGALVDIAPLGVLLNIQSCIYLSCAVLMAAVRARA
jgi:MFS family permease